MVLLGWCLPGGWEAVGWRGAPLLTLGVVIVVSAFRHRVVVGPRGIRYVRSWMGLPWRWRHHSLDARVERESSFDDQWVEIGDPASVFLYTRPEEDWVVRKAIVDAIERARS